MVNQVMKSFPNYYHFVIAEHPAKKPVGHSFMNESDILFVDNSWYPRKFS